MKKKILAVIVLSALSAVSMADSQENGLKNTEAQKKDPLSYQHLYDCDGKDRYLWYCYAKKEKEQKKPQKEQESNVSKPQELVDFEALQKELKDKLHIAYMNPTPENVANYIKLQNYVMKKASIFTDVWKRVIWQTPELDLSIQRPIASMAKAAEKRIEQLAQNANFKKLKDEGYGLFFFYSDECVHCKKMELPLKFLHEDTGLEILPISVSGKVLPEFPDSVVDKGQAVSMGVKVIPSLFLVNTKTNKFQPIASGWVPTNELKKRIYMLTATKPGENY